MATNPGADLVLTPIGREGRPLGEWLTTFHLATVVLDPYTNESAWVLEPAARILRAFAGAAVRVNFVLTSSAEDATSFLGPLVKEFLVFADPERTVVKALGLAELPAFVFILADGTVPAAAEGWDAAEWRKVVDAIATTTAWSRPTVGIPGDPGSFRGTPAMA